MNTVTVRFHSTNGYDATVEFNKSIEEEIVFLLKEAFEVDYYKAEQTESCDVVTMQISSTKERVTIFYDFMKRIGTILMSKSITRQVGLNLN